MALPTYETPPELVEKILQKAPEELPTFEEIRAGMGGQATGQFFKTHPEKAAQQNYKWWDADTRVRAVALYQIYGNLNKVSEILDMPSGTIRRWKTEDWWEDVTKKIRAEKNEEMDAKMTQIIEKAMKAVEDRLENGDVQITKEGEIFRAPVKLRDAVYTSEKLIDKRNLLRGEPTRISESGAVGNRLEQLKEQFKRFVNAKEIKGESKSDTGPVDESGGVETQETGIVEEGQNQEIQR